MTQPEQVDINPDQQSEQVDTITDQQPFEELLHERESIEKWGRMQWFHWLVVALSVIATAGAWHFTQQQAEEKAKNKFARDVDHVLDLIFERLNKYEDELWGGVSALLAHGGDMAYEDWRVFAANLHLDASASGLNGIGVIHHVRPGNLESYLAKQRRTRPDFRVHPKHQKPEYLPVSYIEPLQANVEAVGLDIAHETHRYAAALKARDTGEAQITGRITLKQDEFKTPGFWFVAPFYSGGIYKTAEYRRSHFSGLVYAPVAVHKLFNGVLDKKKRQLRIQLRDASETIYDEHRGGDQDHDPDPLFSTDVNRQVYGRTWTFDIRSTKSFRAATANSEPTIVLAGGIFIDLLLFTLFVSLSRANRRTVNFADRVAEQHERKAKALQESENRLEGVIADLQRANVDLKRFAYVASHDLQEPLRKLQQFTDFLEKDYGETLDSNAKYFLDVICSSSSRMSNLIKDLLAYSRSSNRELEPTDVNLTEVANSILSEIGLTVSEANATIDIAPLPTITAHLTAVEHLMRNLIGNAIKYRHPERGPIIRISSKYNGSEGSTELRITDNGIGFDPQYRDHILEPFQRLHNKDDYSGSGIGLAVCNAICQRHGWQLHADSEVGKGSTFSVIIPSIEIASIGGQAQ